MNLPKSEIINLGEYTITVDYNGDGELDIIVFDELGEEVEGLFISNASDDDIDMIDYVDPKLN